MDEEKEQKIKLKLEALHLAVNISAINAGAATTSTEHLQVVAPEKVLDTAKQIWEWLDNTP